MTDTLLARLNHHIMQMAPQHREREAGRLLIEARDALAPMSDDQMAGLVEQALQGHASTREAMRWLVRRVEARQPCIGRDPLCPCQDGDACHYRDAADGAKGWAAPQAGGLSDAGIREREPFEAAEVIGALRTLGLDSATLCARIKADIADGIDPAPHLTFVDRLLADGPKEGGA